MGESLAPGVSLTLPLSLQPWHPSSTTVTASARSTQSAPFASRTFTQPTSTRSGKLEERTRRTGCHAPCGKEWLKHAEQILHESLSSFDCFPWFAF